MATGRPTHSPQTFTADIRPALVCNVEQMIDAQKMREKPVYDARPSGRYDGTEPEPRGGIPSGHMPWSINVPIETVVDPSMGTVFPIETIRSNLERRGVDVSRPALASCGWGIAACTVAFGLYLLGQKDVSVYDGSWLEWASRDDKDIVTDQDFDMKLYYASASPYVRKVVVTAMEAGLDEEIEQVVLERRMWIGDGDPAVAEVNPVGKIPTLIYRNGITLIDSCLICEYLASLVPDAGLLPASGPARWRVLQLQALAQGALDAAVSRFVETQLRPAELQWNDWLARQSVKLDRTFDRFKTMIGAGDVAAASKDVVDLGSITLGCALGYLDQREGGQSWRAGRSALYMWYDAFIQRESMLATVPPPLTPQI